MPPKNKLIEKNGFTLLEVLISLSLLVIVFGGVVSLSLLSSEAEVSAKNNLISSYLADEAMSLVRYKRDLNYILVTTPFNGIATETDGAILSYTINYDGLVETTSTADVTVAPQLYTSGNLYTQSLSTAPTIFKRLVTTTYHDAATPLPARIDVAVSVYWKTDSKQHTYTITSELMDNR